MFFRELLSEIRSLRKDLTDARLRLCRAEIIKLEDGDAVSITYPGQLSAEMIETMKQQWKLYATSIGKPELPCAVFAGGAKLTVVRKSRRTAASKRARRA